MRHYCLHSLVCLTISALSAKAFVIPPAKQEFKELEPLRSHRRFTFKNTKQLSLSKRNNENDDEQLRMAQIRSIQQSFYASSPPVTEATAVDLSTGMITNLPLWRVQWTELPGRSNVLNVFQGHYTHMFETILHSPKPWYVGHLYLPGGSYNLSQNGCELYGLEDLEKELSEENEEKHKKLMAPTIIGTLMRIVDYRRMSDGKLLLLVQGIERFVVTNTVREVPYSIANVQLLPDLEEIHQFYVRKNGDKDNVGNLELSITQMMENDINMVRAQSIRESFKWHAYEYADCKLPAKEGEEITVADVVVADLAKLMPLVPYSSTVSPQDIKEYQGSAECTTCEDRETGITPGQRSLERRLIDAGQYQFHPLSDDSSLDGLEQMIWIAIDNYVKSQTKHEQSTKRNERRSVATPIPLELLFLFPPQQPTQEQEWPKSFALDDIANKATKSMRISDLYPSYRRQRRLGYAAICLLEHRMTAEGLRFESIRQRVLEIPSLRQRLW